MIVSSMMPAVTQMIYDMGLEHMLNGITFECPKQALQEKEVLVRCILEDKKYTSDEINTLFSESKATGKSLYYVNEEVMHNIAPSLVFTQDVCDVCQIDTESAERSLSKLAVIPKTISITPQSLNDVFNDAITIATAMGFPAKGEAYVLELQNQIKEIVDRLRADLILPKSVMLLEWIDPLFNCGHWIPHQIGFAGGVDLLSHPSGDSIVIDWDKIVKYNPEVLVIAPCGYTQERTLEDMKFLEAKAEWSQLKAVRNKQVYIADFDLFTQSSASTLVDGIKVLAKLFHPEVFTESIGLEHKYSNYFNTKN
ncbi:iron complex transport system substrate-binding protein [Wenyingzhuangia heitensis]|uniref:Iron complex transport system substrate-binding protein n=1 Tax=Wenyingzhuangia heitensis TaxID=1487859 RepID=A0ABX0UEH5_9FLAO|nr:ABC transporter substrate-binding protein [Wenyingzhuangia heitensis]NIJ46270.1 iron complex transport system substrate-binding protein [Wenyingzhuangia heitensis]